MAAVVQSHAPHHALSHASAATAMATKFRDPFLMESDDSDSDDNFSTSMAFNGTSAYSAGSVIAPSSVQFLTNTQHRNELSGGRESTGEPIARKSQKFDPNSSPSSEAFNWTGFSQVAELQKQNAELVLALDRAKSQSINAPKPGKRNEVIPDASSRIAGLSKKVRILTSSLEAEKSKCKKSENRHAALERKIETLEEELHRKSLLLQRSQPKSVVPNSENPGSPGSPTPSSVPSPTDSVKQVKGAEGSKLRQLWRQNQSLKKDLQLAHRALVKEIGEKVPVSKILSSQSDWKGRAEQIALLKEKVAALQGTANQIKSNRSSGSKYSSTGVNHQTRAHLRKLENSKKEAKRAAEEEHAQMKIQNATLLEKIDALRARGKVLSRDLKQARNRHEELAQQAIKDRKMIEGLNQKLDGQVERVGEASRSNLDSMMTDNVKLKELCREQREAVEDLQKTVKSLHQQLRSSASRGSSRSASRHGVKSRGGSGRATDGDNSSTKLAEMETRLNLAETERNKMTELVEVLRRQVREESEKALQSNKEKREQARKVQQLKEKMVSLESGSSGVNTSSYSTLPQQLKDAEMKLGLQKDDNDILRIRLDDMATRKEEEIRVYEKLLQDARRVYAQGLKSFRAAQLQAENRQRQPRPPSQPSKRNTGAAHSSGFLPPL